MGTPMAFTASGWRRPTAAAVGCGLIALSVVNLLLRFDMLTVGNAAAMLILGLYLLAGVARRSRHAVLVISPAGLEFTPAFSAGRRQIPITDLETIAWENLGHLGVRLVSGETIGLDLRDLNRSDRARVKAELSRIIHT
jgi:hypothetical protein